VPIRHISIYVSKATHEVACVEYSERSIDAGAKINQRTVDELFDCMSYNLWSGRLANQLTAIDLPEWAIGMK